TAAKPVGLALGLPIARVGGGFRAPLLTAIPAGVLPPGVTVPQLPNLNAPPPTATPAPGTTPTATVPAGPTATPTLASTAGFAFVPKGSASWEPNCGLTLIKGYIYKRDGSVFPGVTVKVWTAGWDGAISFPARNDGYWDVLLDAVHAKSGLWSVAVVKKETGELQSPTVQVDT